MTRKQRRSPHYIPELDPERSKFDWNWFSDFYYCLAYLVFSGAGAFYFFRSREIALGFGVAGFGLGLIALSLWLRRREIRKDEIRMERDRENADSGEASQSPHYIPELDPGNARNKKGFADPVLWVSAAFTALSLVGAVVAVIVGFVGPAKFFAATGAVSFSPLALIAFDGFSAGGA